MILIGKTIFVVFHLSNMQPCNSLNIIKPCINYVYTCCLKVIRLITIIKKTICSTDVKMSQKSCTPILVACK